jgi:hypothetical protein
MNVEQILHHLAMAFGGHSQYSLAHVADAIVGQINNNGLRGDPESLAAEAARCLEDRYADAGFDGQEAAVVIRHHIDCGLHRFGITSA